MSGDWMHEQAAEYQDLVGSFVESVVDSETDEMIEYQLIWEGGDLGVALTTFENGEGVAVSRVTGKGFPFGIKNVGPGDHLLSINLRDFSKLALDQVVQYLQECDLPATLRFHKLSPDTDKTPPPAPQHTRQSHFVITSDGPTSPSGSKPPPGDTRRSTQTKKSGSANWTTNSQAGSQRGSTRSSQRSSTRASTQNKSAGNSAMAKPSDQMHKDMEQALKETEEESFEEEAPAPGNRVESYSGSPVLSEQASEKPTTSFNLDKLTIEEHDEDMPHQVSEMSVEDTADLVGMEESSASRNSLVDAREAAGPQVVYEDSEDSRSSEGRDSSLVLPTVPTELKSEVKAALKPSDVSAENDIEGSDSESEVSSAGMSKWVRSSVPEQSFPRESGESDTSSIPPTYPQESFQSDSVESDVSSLPNERPTVQKPRDKQRTEVDKSPEHSPSQDRLRKQSSGVAMLGNYSIETESVPVLPEESEAGGIGVVDDLTQAKSPEVSPTNSNVPKESIRMTMENTNEPMMQSQPLDEVHAMCQKGNLRGVVQHIKVHGTDALAEREPNHGQSGLHLAAKSGNVQLVKYIVDHYQPLEDLLTMVDDKGNTVVHFAATKKPAMVHCLLESGANANVKNSRRFTPLIISVITNKDDNVLIPRMLLKFGANPNDLHDGQTVIHTALDRGLLKTAGALLRAGAKLDVEDSEGRNVFEKLNRKSTRVLLEHVYYPPTFISEKERTNCMMCQKKFKFGTRKANCTHCGRVLCHDCCALTVELYKFPMGFPGRIRRGHANHEKKLVCKTCFGIFKEREGEPEKKESRFINRVIGIEWDEVNPEKLQAPRSAARRGGTGS